MNAESMKQAPAIGSKEFLDSIEKFHQKCLRKEKITQDDVSTFYNVITSTQKKTSQNAISGSRSFLADPDFADKTSSLLHQLQSTLGRSKEIIETAAKTIPYQHIEKALDSLTAFVDEERRKNKTVSRKDSGAMPHHQK